LESFFASCEQQRDPSLRGKPVGVIPMMAETTCCIAASYEAKACGVKTGTSVSEARWLCPQIKFVIAGHANYVKIHHQVIEAAETAIPVTAVRSIDEFCAELPPNWRSEAKVRAVAAEVRQAIADRVGPYISCSIGVGPNVLLSKIGSGMNKPRGLTILHENNLPGPLAQLELPDLYGIGKRMHLRLLRHGVRTVTDLYACSRAKLHSIWGSVEGDRLYSELRGEIIEHAETIRRQVSHSHVLAPQMRSHEAAFAVIHRLTQKAAMRLRKLDHYAGSLQIGVRLGFDYKFKRQARFFPTQESRIFLRWLRELWSEIPPDSPAPCKVSVVLGELLSAANYTPPLFSTMNNERNVKLDTAMDTLNKKLGPKTLYYAGAHAGRSEAPMRIAFTHIPDLETEAD
ncbi:MAG: DNA polymerase Y family protein, partial [Puniceicoccales bacterium]